MNVSIFGLINIIDSPIQKLSWNNQSLPNWEVNKAITIKNLMRYALLIFAVSMLKAADVSKEVEILGPGIKFLSILTYY